MMRSDKFSQSLQGAGLKADSTATMVFLLIGASVMAMLFGAIAGLGNLLFIVMVLGVVLVLTLVGYPTLLIYIVTIGGLVVAGLAQLYVPLLQQIRWVVAGFALILPFSILLVRLGGHSREASRQPNLTIWISLIFVSALITSVLNLTKLGTIVLGWKDYFQVWGLLFAFALLGFNRKLYFSLPKLLLVVALIQLPFVLHQFLYIVPERQGLRSFGIVPVDIVVGTFGGERTGGGNNALLTAFQVFVFAVMASRYRLRLTSGFAFFLVSLLLLVPLFLNETKIAVVYIVLVVLIVFRKELLARPAYFVGVTGASAIFAFGLIFSYGALNSTGQDSISDIVDRTIRQNTDEKEKYGLLELNRLSSLTFWGREHIGKRWPALFFGHGLGESKEGTAGVIKRGTLAETVYPGMGIGLTSISGLLWDMGIVGTLAVVMMFISAYRLAGKLSRELVSCSEQAALFSGMQAGIAVLLLSLAHKAFFVFLLGYQVFVMLVFGYLIYAWRHRSSILADCASSDILPS